MWALVSPQANASLETWGQKLDLTTQSSEMPSTLGLDLKDKQEIMRGWTCCYRQELLDSVRQEHLEKLTGYSLRENPKRLQFTLVEPISNTQWATFVALQLADIYTTHQGLQYQCVKEINPLIGENPSVHAMFYTKWIILQPAIKYDLNNGNLDQKVLSEINFFMSLVILNNYNVWKKGEKNCPKR